MKRIVNDAPGDAPRRGVLGQVVFEAQSADDEPALAVIQLHQRRIA